MLGAKPQARIRQAAHALCQADILLCGNKMAEFPHRPHKNSVPAQAGTRGPQRLDDAADRVPARAGTRQAHALSA